MQVSRLYNLYSMDVTGRYDGRCAFCGSEFSLEEVMSGRYRPCLLSMIRS
jgi:hypothetical protein